MIIFKRLMEIIRRSRHPAVLDQVVPSRSFPPGWEATRAYNMRCIESEFINGADIRSMLAWAMDVGNEFGDTEYVYWAVTLQKECQARIDTGELMPDAESTPNRLTPVEIAALRDHYR